MDLLERLTVADALRDCVCEIDDVPLGVKVPVVVMVPDGLEEGDCVGEADTVELPELEGVDLPERVTVGEALRESEAEGVDDLVAEELTVLEGEPDAEPEAEAAV